MGTVYSKTSQEEHQVSKLQERQTPKLMTTYKIIKAFFALTSLLAMTESLPTLPCSLHCAQDSPQVCGTDGKTYDNECHLMNSNGFTEENCRVPNGVRVYYQGSCDAPISPIFDFLDYSSLADIQGK